MTKTKMMIFLKSVLKIKEKKMVKNEKIKNMIREKNNQNIVNEKGDNFEQR